MKTKRLIAALLAACLSLAPVLPASAAGSIVSQEEALQAVAALGILSGEDQGGLDRPVTRAEFTAMAVKAAPGGDRVGQAAVSLYPDVSRDHWAAGYVEAGVSLGLVSGFSDGSFRPDQAVSLAEGVSVALKLLGYGPGDFSGVYPTGQLALYRSLKLDRGLSAGQAGSPLTLRDAVYLFYNLLTAKTKEGVPYLNTLGHQLTPSGQIDTAALVGSTMDGPMVAQGNWQSALPLELSSATVTRNGRPSSPSAIQEQDVLYWNAALGAVWACSDKVSGVIQALDSTSGPTSVTVAGRAYPIETASAAYALSDLGPYGLGDTVTLLLGRTGGVAALSEGAAVQDRAGVVVSLADTAYPDGKGGTYSVRTATLLSTDGQTYQYPCTDTGIREGSLLRSTVDGEGSLRLRGLSGSSLSGRISSDGTKLGSLPLARDAEILDISGSQGARVFPSRLAGLELSRDKVLWYSQNSAGEIDRMILRDVTGDMYRYGILTNLTEEHMDSLSFLCSYEYDLQGQRYALSGSIRYPVETGPVLVKGNPENPDTMSSLTGTGQGELSGTRFLAGGREYALSDSVAVYERRDGQYSLSSLARVGDGSFELSAWYDAAQSAGGRIRVIVAQEKS